MAMKFFRTSSLYLLLAARSTKSFAPASRGLFSPLVATSSSSTIHTSGLLQQQHQQQSYQRTAGVLMMAKAGVAPPDELKDFVTKAGSRLVVIDVRNPDADKEPGDQKSLAVAALPSESNRPQAISLIWDRSTDSMPLPDLEDKETPIITHCGGGGRGQKAKDFLEKNGYTNVLNGGGPKETECWAEFGSK